MATIDVIGYLSGKGLWIWSEKNGEIRVNCPICNPPDAKGHLYISFEGLFMCHKCGESGNFYQLQKRLGDQPQGHSLLQESKSNNQTLHDVASYYATQLSPEIRRYLNERRIDDDAIKKYMLGYASGRGLNMYLADKGYSIQQMKVADLITANGSEFFRDKIIIPYLSHGKVTLLRARTNPFSDSDKIYFPLPNTEVQLFNRDVLSGGQDAAVITEGEFDCIVLSQQGFTSVGVPGANSFSEDWKGLFDRIRTIFVCFDGDEKGRQGAMRVARILGPLTLIVEMPESQDVTSLFVSARSKDDFQELLDKARTLLDIEIESVAALPENLRMPKLRRIITLLAELPTIESKHYRSVVAKEFGVGVKVIDAGLSEHKKKLKKEAAQKKTDEKEVFTDDEKARAQKLLEDPQLIERILDAAEAHGCIGEDNNKLMVYFTLTSRILDDPIGLLVKGESSGGKSHIVESVIRFFPKHEIMDFTSITAKALFHSSESFSHKALVICERPGAEEADYPIRSMQSEKSLKMLITVKNPETEEFQTKVKEIPGPIAYVETTTKTHIHSENETRNFEIFIDESEEQTRKIQESQLIPYSGRKGGIDVDFRAWQALQTKLEPLPVHIPYCNLIRFPTKPLRVRRDFPRFLILIVVSAILHQYQRRRKVINGKEHVVASIADYGVAYNLADSILRQTVKSLTPKAEEVIRFIAGYIEGKPDVLYTLREIAEGIGWKKNTVKKHHKNCVSEGLVECVEGRQGVAHKYSFVRLPDENDSLLIPPDEMKRLMKDNRTNRARPGQNSLAQVNPTDDSDLTPLDPPIQPETGE